jgi:pimeloyl-ACP methyl ester carboxylesterase
MTPTLVLVHGGWHGGWCWERTTPALVGAGFAVRTPTLVNAPDVGLDDHAAQVAGEVRQAERPVVIVAHSYGGAVVEVAAPVVADHLAGIVHLDSFALAAGEAVIDFFPPDMAAAIVAQAQTTGDGWQVDPLPPELFGLHDPADLEWVMPRLTPAPLRALTDRAGVGTGAEAVPRTYIECTEGSDQKPFGFFAARGRALGWDVRTLDTGHDAMVTAPAALAQMLVAVAGSARERSLRPSR